jgi:Leucine Rich repeat
VSYTLLHTHTHTHTHTPHNRLIMDGAEFVATPFLRQASTRAASSLTSQAITSSNTASANAYLTRGLNGTPLERKNSVPLPPRWSQLRESRRQEKLLEKEVAKVHAQTQARTNNGGDGGDDDDGGMSSAQVTPNISHSLSSQTDLMSLRSSFSVAQSLTSSTSSVSGMSVPTSTVAATTSTATATDGKHAIQNITEGDEDEEEEEEDDAFIFDDVAVHDRQVQDADELAYAEEFVYAIYEAKCKDISVNATDAGFERFKISFLKRKNTISGLDLRGLGIGTNVAAMLCDLLKDDTEIKTLDLRKNNLGDDGIALIAKLVGQNTNIVGVDISSNDISPNGFATFFQHILTSGVRTLNASSSSSNKNTLGRKGSASLAAALQNSECQLRHVTLNAVAPASFDVIASGLTSNRSLRSLQLQHNKLSSQELSLLCLALKNSNVSELNISNNTLDATAAMALLDLFRQRVPIRSLNLSSVFAAINGADAVRQRVSSFCKQLRSVLEEPDCALEELILDNNDLYDAGVQLFAPALAVNSSLQSLSLKSCNIKADGAAALTQGLFYNGCLIALNLKHNSIADLGATYLAEALDHSGESICGLLHLHLGNNYIGDQGAVAMSDALLHNNALQELILTQNMIKDEGGRALLHAISGDHTCSNTTLLHIDVKLNACSYGIAEKIARMLRLNRQREHNDMIAEFNREVGMLKDDERRLVVVREDIQDLEAAFRDSNAKRQQIEGNLQAWKENEVDITHSLSEKLSDLLKFAEDENLRMKNVLRSTEQSIREEKLRYTEKSALLSYKIGNQKRVRYNRVEVMRKEQAELDKILEVNRREELQLQGLQEECETETAAGSNLQNYIESSKQKLDSVRSDILVEYQQHLSKFVELLHRKEEMEARLQEIQIAGHTFSSFGNAASVIRNSQASPYAPTAKSIVRFLERLDVEEFSRWMMHGMPELVLPKSVRNKSRNIHVNDSVQLQIRVIRPEDERSIVEHTSIIQKSHTIHSLSIHGLRRTVFVAADGVACAKALQNDKSWIAVKGAQTIPQVMEIISDTLGIPQYDIRSMYYDPCEHYRCKAAREDGDDSVMSRASRHSAGDMSIGGNDDYDDDNDGSVPSVNDEPHGESVSMFRSAEMMHEASDEYNAFARQARAALRRFNRRMRKFDRRYSTNAADLGDTEDDMTEMTADASYDPDVHTQYVNEPTSSMEAKVRAAPPAHESTVATEVKQRPLSSSSKTSSTSIPQQSSPNVQQHQPMTVHVSKSRSNSRQGSRASSAAPSTAYSHRAMAAAQSPSEPILQTSEDLSAEKPRFSAPRSTPYRSSWHASRRRSTKLAAEAEAAAIAEAQARARARAQVAADTDQYDRSEDLDYANDVVLPQIGMNSRQVDVVSRPLSPGTIARMMRSKQARRSSDTALRSSVSNQSGTGQTFHVPSAQARRVSSASRQRQQQYSVPGRRSSALQVVVLKANQFKCAFPTELEPQSAPRRMSARRDSYRRSNSRTRSRSTNDRRRSANLNRRRATITASPVHDGSFLAGMSPKSASKKVPFAASPEPGRRTRPTLSRRATSPLESTSMMHRVKANPAAPAAVTVDAITTAPVAHNISAMDRKRSSYTFSKGRSGSIGRSKSKATAASAASSSERDFQMWQWMMSGSNQRSASDLFMLNRSSSEHDSAMSNTSIVAGTIPTVSHHNEFTVAAAAATVSNDSEFL